MISDSRKYLLVPRMKKDEAVEFCSQFPNGRFPNSMEEIAQIITKVLIRKNNFANSNEFAYNNEEKIWIERFFFDLVWNSTNSGFVTNENEQFPCKYSNRFLYKRKRHIDPLWLHEKTSHLTSRNLI